MPARSERQRGRHPSQRQLRVGEAIRHELAELLQRGDTHHPDLEGVSVTVSEVRVTPDLRHATAFVVELGRRLRPETAAALAEVAVGLKGRIARQLHLKYTPELRFAEDESFVTADRIERILAEQGVGRADDGGGDRGPA